MFPSSFFGKAKTSSFYTPQEKPQICQPQQEEIKLAVQEDKSNAAILEKLESICAKLAEKDEIVAEFKQKTDELMKSMQPQPSLFGTPQQLEIPPQQMVTSIASHRPQEPVQESRKKKNYKKLTPDLMEEVYRKYPQFPRDIQTFTTDGEDLYAQHKSKKIKIENLAHVLSLIK